MKEQKKGPPRWVEQTVWLNSSENEPIDFCSLVSVSTAHFLCVLLYFCLIGCMLKCYTLQEQPLLSVIKWQIGGTMFFQRSQAHHCVSRSTSSSFSLLCHFSPHLLPFSFPSSSPAAGQPVSFQVSISVVFFLFFI